MLKRADFAVILETTTQKKWVGPVTAAFYRRPSGSFSALYISHPQLVRYSSASGTLWVTFPPTPQAA